MNVCVECGGKLDTDSPYLCSNCVDPTDAPEDRVCSIEGCTRKYRARGLCASHLDRLHHGQKVEAPMMDHRSSLWTRIMDRVQQGNGGCWLYSRSLSDNGYAHVTYKSRSYLVHRAMYEIHKGPIPDGLVIDHLCRNRACCNPEHLEAVEHGENVRRGAQATKQFCPHGHYFSPENTIIRPDGSRNCRTCHYIRVNDRKRRIREAEKAERAAEREREARETVPYDRDAFPSGTAGPWGDAA